MDTIASRYANALLELAIENNKVVEYQNQMKFVYSVIKENPNLVDFFKCYTIENKDKKELINKIFKDEVCIEILHFLYNLSYYSYKKRWFVILLLWRFHPFV